MRFRALALFVVGTVTSTIAVVVGCGLDVVGTGPGDGGTEPGVVVPLPDGGVCVTTGNEVCEDGLDNDCNGLADCADPACTTHQCVDAPAGWNVVTVTKRRASTADSGTDRPADAGTESCPSGWGNARVFLDTPRATKGDCDCRCGVAPAGTNPCLGSTAIGQTDNDDGNPICDDVSFEYAIDGGCNAFTQWGETQRIRMTPPGPTNVACPALPPLLPPVVDDGALTVCDVASDAGICSAGACVVKPAEFAICLAHAGALPTCPAGFGTPRVLRAEEGIADGRACAAGCGGCTTTTTLCGNTRLDLYSDVACATLMQNIPVNGVCNLPSINQDNPGSYRYFAVPNTIACAPGSVTTVAVNGALGLPPETTICCPP